MTQRIIVLIIVLGVGRQQKSMAQNELSQITQVEVCLGWVTPFLRDGNELMRSESLRNDGLSYFADPDGNRRTVGDYPTPSGFSFGIGFYKPFVGPRD